jgi:pimeloyl-[acyl-carrier protein] methyl ester esterase
VSLRVERGGQGPPLVLLHGWGLHGGVFHGLAARLGERFETWCVDLPGHGGSGPLARFTLETVARAVAERVPAGALWLGWSLGGMVALAAAAQARAARLVLVSASPRFVADGEWPGVAPALLDGFAADLEVDHRATLNRFIALQARGSEQARAEFRALREGLFDRGEPDLAALRGGLAILKEADLRPVLGGIAQPLLLVGGRRDTLVPPPALERTAKALPRGEAVVLDGAGHAPFISHPAAFDAVVTEFLNG